MNRFTFFLGGGTDAADIGSSNSEEIRTGKTPCAAVNLPIWSTVRFLLGFSTQTVYTKIREPPAAAQGHGCAAWDLERREDV